MAATNTDQKQDNKQSPALRDALARQHIEVIRSLHENLIRNCRDHLNECHKPECLECKDARVLIPYYQEEMESELRACGAVK